jgi:hypothetical protein
MPYEHLEEFLERGDEKFFGPLSITNLGGALLGGGLGYQAASMLGLPLGLTAASTLALVCLGIALTWRVGGMTALSRIYWLLRFWAPRALDSHGHFVEAGRPTAATGPARPPLLLRRGGRTAARVDAVRLPTPMLADDGRAGGEQ